MLSLFSLTSWHGIDTLTVDLRQRTYIMGANGSGKTHILDALHILSGSRPLYGDATLESGTQFEGIFLHSSDLAKSYRVVRDDTREYFAIQGTKVTKPKYMIALPWRTVHISPFDMNLLYFAPSMRRDYMDLILTRTYEQFHHVRRDYDLVMRQRNALLKKIRDGQADSEDLNFWDRKFAEYAESYGLYRNRYCNYVRDNMSQFPTFFSKYGLIFFYESSVANYRIKIQNERGGNLDMQTDSEIITDYLLENRKRDILTGHTHIGPHRDDWGFQIPQKHESKMQNSETNNGFFTPVESYLSRGEMKMLLLGLKMLEREFMSTTLDLPVILLVDDIFAELDDINSDIFLSSLMQHQIILTSQKPLPNHEKYHDFICINLGND